MVTNETMIPITKKTRDMIRSIGSKNETYDQIIVRIGEFYMEFHGYAEEQQPKPRRLKA